MGLSVLGADSVQLGPPVMRERTDDPWEGLSRKSKLCFLSIKAGIPHNAWPYLDLYLKPKDTGQIWQWVVELASPSNFVVSGLDLVPLLQDPKEA